MQVLPALRDDGVWQHPLVAGAFDDELRGRLLEAADRAPAYVEELDARPTTASPRGRLPEQPAALRRTATASC